MPSSDHDSSASPDINSPPSHSGPILPTVNPAVAVEKPSVSSHSVHPAVYISSWIALSSSVILFNKYILDRLQFHFPIFLTTWHLACATVLTQILARTTRLLDSRRSVPMTGPVYLRAIVPIGFFFSLSLICGNVTYLYLSVSFIQMLKAITPVAVLLTGWAMGTSAPDYKTLLNVCVIVIGVMIASFGEIKFVLIGVIFQLAGLTFEAIRIVMVERLLSSADFKMDPIVSLYYFAPACTTMNAIVCLFLEVPWMSLEAIAKVGLVKLVLNGLVAFALNVAVVMLIGRTSSLVYTLSGVLKDILLVFASIEIFGDPVRGLQVFGYGVALFGLIYYKLGAETIRAHAGEVGRAWTDYGIRHPLRRKIGACAGIIIGIYVMMRVFAPVAYVPYDPASLAMNKINQFLGDKTE